MQALARDRPACTARNAWVRRIDLTRRAALHQFIEESTVLPQRATAGAVPRRARMRARRRRVVIVGITALAGVLTLVAPTACSDRSMASVPAPPIPSPTPDDGAWTPLQPSSDTLDVYVSSSAGLDGNDGLAPDRPKRTIAAAIALLRDNHPDWLHIRRGDEFAEFGDWTLSGRSPTEPMVVTTYGPSLQRPLFRCKYDSGLTVHSVAIHDVAFTGLHLLADTDDGNLREPFGISMLVPSTRVLFEDCQVERFFTNLRFQGTHSDLRVRRSVICDAFTVGASHAQGIYAENVDGMLIEECVFDHNGWRPEVAGAVPTIFRHDIYMQGNTANVVIRGNVIARAGSHGLQARSGGDIRGNLFFANPINMLVGNDIENDGAVTASVIGNVMMEGRDIDERTRRGWAAMFQCIESGEIAYNVAAHQHVGTLPRSYVFDSSLGVGIKSAEFHHNVSYRWGAPMALVGDRFAGFVLRDNDLQESGPTALLRADKQPTAESIMSNGNRLFSDAPGSQWVFYNQQYMSLDSWRMAITDPSSAAVRVAYPRAELTLADYDLATGGIGSAENFLLRARAQSRTNWDRLLVGTNVTAAFRANFGIVLPK